MGVSCSIKGTAEQSGEGRVKDWRASFTRLLTSWCVLGLYFLFHFYFVAMDLIWLAYKVLGSKSVPLRALNVLCRRILASTVVAKNSATNLISIAL